MRIIAPSMLSANFLNLQKDIEMINNSEAEWIHLDIMDGVFVPNISYGFPVIKAIASASKKKLDAHLMIVDPDRYFDNLAELGVGAISVHYEACNHLHRSMQRIKDLGILAGVAINPHTPVSVLEEIIEFTDFILIMSVNPGFGGQNFISSTIEKVRKLKLIANAKKPNLLIQVDGGVSVDNAKELFNAGANILVAGNSVFSSSNPIEAINFLKNA